MAPTKKKPKKASKEVLSDKKPVKTRKKTGDANDESTSEPVVPDNKRVEDEGKKSDDVKESVSKTRKKMGNANHESTSEPAVSDKKKVEDENKSCDVKESVTKPVVKKPCTWLKRLDPQTGDKSSVQKSNQGKQTESTSQIQTPTTENKRKRLNRREERRNSDHKRDEKYPNRRFDEKGTNPRLEEKEKRTVNEQREDIKDEVDESGKNLGGLIFMCNSKTKPDCLRYQVMGVPANKKELVMRITPGLKLFLYDYDVKLMYGIFKSSSAGGMKLEPLAFGGGFPAQVRFTVHKDCLPLPESTFKKAMKDCYDERTHKFKTELTMKQVRRLTDLYRPAPSFPSNGQYSVQEHDPRIHRMPTETLLHEESISRQRYLDNFGFSDAVKASPLHHENRISGHHVPSSSAPSRSPLFISEQEYRSFGLQQGRHLLPTTGGNDVRHSWEPSKLDEERELLSRYQASTRIDSAVQQREANKHHPFFLSEEEYRTYGLRAPSQMQNAASSMMTTNEVITDSVKNTYNPYDDSTTALVNRYLNLPRTTGMLSETHHLPGREHFINDLNNSSDRTNPNLDRHFASYNLHEQSDLNQRPYSLYDSREPSGINPGVYTPNETDMISAPVSRRYSFAGPSPSLNR